MSMLHIIVLAVVQGIAEFLPISSSGHLVIVDKLLGGESDVVDVNIVLHAGTLLSIIVFFWHRIWRLLGADRATIPRLIVGTLPVVIVGLIVKLKFEHLLQNPLLAGCMLLVTAAILFYTSRQEHHRGKYQQLSYPQTLGIGLAQALAILPGISRSGTTICAGLVAGLSRTDAATFSFLLAIPAIGGASVLELKEMLSGAQLTTPVPNLLVGATVAFAVGLASLWALLKVLEKGKLEYFAYWCLLVGAGVIVWLR
jgi:undecaprenyl-diphosphatase